MKKLNLFFVILVLLMPAMAQDKIEVKESVEKIGEGHNNALTVMIYEAEDKDVIKAWKQLMKNYDCKTSGRNDIFADDATIPSISTNTIDVYASISKKGDGIMLVVGFNLGGAYLNSSEHGAAYKAAEKIIYDFAVSITKNAINDKIDKQEKELKKLENEYDELTKEKERLESTIEKCKEKIKEAEEGIKTNIKEQEKTTEAIENQKNNVVSTKEKLKNVK